LKNSLNKTPNSSPDQSLIAAFRKRNSNCIFLKILLARMPLFFMSALVLNYNELYTDLLQIFMVFFTGSRKLLLYKVLQSSTKPFIHAFDVKPFLAQEIPHHHLLFKNIHENRVSCRSKCYMQFLSLLLKTISRFVVGKDYTFLRFVAFITNI
jgi:hypothetical protein